MKIKEKHIGFYLLLMLLILLIIFILVFICSCSYRFIDSLESSHYRKFRTEAVVIDSIIGKKIYVSDFLPSDNVYWIVDFDGEVGDTIYFRECQDKIIDFKYLKK